MFENFSAYEDLSNGSPTSLENIFSRDEYTKFAYLADQINFASELAGMVVMEERSSLPIRCHSNMHRFELDSVKSLQFSDSQRIKSVHSIYVNFEDLGRLENISEINSLFKDIKILNPNSKVMGLDFYDIQGNAKLKLNQNIKTVKNSPITWISDKKYHVFFEDALKDQNKLIDLHKTVHLNGMKTQICIPVDERSSVQNVKGYLHKIKQLNSETRAVASIEVFSRSPLTETTKILKILSMVRLILPEVLEVCVSIENIGPEMAQMSLLFGANTIIENTDAPKIFQPYFSGQKIVKKAGKILYEGGKVETNSHGNPDKVSNILKELVCQIKDQLVLSKNSSDVLEQAINFSSYFDLLNLMDHPEGGEHATLAPTVDFQLRDLNSYQSFSDYREHQIKSLTVDAMNSEWLPINIDLAGVNKSGKELSLNDLYHVLEHFKSRSSEASLMISGVRGFWRLAQEAKISLGEAFHNISRLGGACFQSSRFEAEGGLTLSELRNLHFAAHEHGLFTVPKVELVVPPWGGTPMWASFVHRLLTYIILSKESRGIPGISIELSRDSFISIVDYLKAITLARLLCPPEVSVISNIYRTPLMAKYPDEIKRSDEFHPALSLLVLKSGANDLGMLPLHKWNYKKIVEFFTDQGINISLRGPRFGMIFEPERFKIQ